MEITVPYVISQIFTICSYIMIGLTYQVKNRKTVLLLHLGAQITFLISFVFLNAWSGLAMSIVALIRNAIFIIDENKNGKRKNINKTDIFVLVMVYIATIISAFFTYEGFFSLFSVFATMIYTYAVCQKNIKTYKMLGILTETSWLCYNVYIKSIFGIVLQVITLMSCLIGYVREVNKNRRKKI